MTPEIIFAHFKAAVNHVADNIRLFVNNPDGDFTRNGKIPIKKLLSFLVYQGSNTLGIRGAFSPHTFNIADLLSKELTAIRPNRHFSRLKTAHFRKPAYFIYRPS